MTDLVKVMNTVTVTDSVLTATSVPETDYAAWSSSTAYAIGARVILTSTHKVYEALQAGTNKNPATELTYWLEVSPTNRWKPFDLSSTVAVEFSTSAYYELTPGQAINSVGLIAMSGITSIRVRLIDPSYGTVYDQTTDTAAKITESSWYAWFFDPRTEQSTFVCADLPAYPTAKVRIDVTAASTASIGVIVIGQQREIGMIAPRTGARIGIQDYSRKERNQFGDTLLVKRAYAKRSSISMMVANSDLDRTYALLADIRSTPCLWTLSVDYDAMVIFGFYNNFEITIAYRDYSELSIDIEGLT